MNNRSKMDDMDLLLYAAMPYTGKKEIEEYSSIDPSVELSTKADKRIYKRLNREMQYHERHEIYHPVRDALKRVAVIVLIIMSIGFMSAVSIEAVRNEIFNVVIEWFEKSLSISIENENSDKVPDRILEYKEPELSDDYERFEIQKNDFGYLVEYENGISLISFRQKIYDNYDFKVSNENTIVEDIQVNGYEGIKTVFTTEEITTTTIIWKDDEYAYSLSSNIPYDDLIKIAESIK